MDMTIEKKYAIITDQYSFELIRVNNFNETEWLLTNESCKQPTNAEMFEIISNIFNNINIVKNICMYVDGCEHWVSRGVTELEFYQKVF